MTRAVPAWRGKTDDATIPPRVKLAVFEAHDGRCALSGRKIMPGDAWEIDHRIPLALGGEHAQHNLQPVLRDKHREKTREDVAAKAKAAGLAKKHHGIGTGRKAVIPGSKASGWKRRIDGTVVRRTPE